METLIPVLIHVAIWSTLLVLVAAFAGLENIRRCYEEAIRLRYRFYSYGDAMLIL